jgi:hypothetical protein
MKVMRLVGKKKTLPTRHNDRNVDSNVGSNHEIHLLEPISRCNFKAVALASSLQRLSISPFKKNRE